MAYINPIGWAVVKISADDRFKRTTKWLDPFVCLWILSGCRRIVNVQYATNVLKEPRKETFFVAAK